MKGYRVCSVITFHQDEPKSGEFGFFQVNLYNQHTRDGRMKKKNQSMNRPLLNSTQFHYIEWLKCTDRSVVTHSCGTTPNLDANVCRFYRKTFWVATGDATKRAFGPPWFAGFKTLLVSNTGQISDIRRLRKLQMFATILLFLKYLHSEHSVFAFLLKSQGQKFESTFK